MLPEGFILRMQSLLGEEYAAFSACMWYSDKIYRSWPS